MPADPHPDTGDAAADASPQADRNAPSAALLIIGNEILSGRTQDANIAWLGSKLSAMGIPVQEVRIVRDEEAEIIAALDALRARYTYVFTTGGIGPTHDDITAGSVAKAFGVALVRDAEAARLLTERIGADRMNEARLKMADMPEGARLIVNQASGAPGFAMDNVFVLAGVPFIMQAMFDAVAEQLEGGRPILSATVGCNLTEGTIAEALGAVQDRFPTVEIGSYPYWSQGRGGVNLVVRGTDTAAVDAAITAIRDLITALGDTPIDRG